MDLDIGVLTDGGLLFLWVINSQMQLGLECMSKWGFLYTDRVRRNACCGSIAPTQR